MGRVLLAVDDTDAPDGMCTTYLARRLPAVLEADLADPPRLVRLHPAAPWKTRGNGALVLPLESPLEPRELVEAAAPAVRDRAAPGASPALAAAEAPLDPQTYLAAVRRLLDPAWARTRLQEAGAAYEPLDGDRALVGCAAALGWRPDAPDRPASWTLLAHRPPDRWDEPRQAPADALRALAEEHPAIFDAVDEATGEVVGVPSTPGPVVLGLRATAPGPLREARQALPVPDDVTLTLFRTNQASDDHLVRRPAADLQPDQGAVVLGRVADEPWRTDGGHVFAPLEGEDGGRIRLAAFEPTKAFRHAVTALAPGDAVEAHGLVREGPDGPALHLGRLRVLDAPAREEKAANPACPDCGSRMASAGADAGYRCRGCGTAAPEDAAPTRRRDRDLEPGWYEAPPDARRHLARPARLLEGPVHDPAKAYNPNRSIPQR